MIYSKFLSLPISNSIFAQIIFQIQISDLWLMINSTISQISNQEAVLGITIFAQLIFAFLLSTPYTLSLTDALNFILILE